MYLYVRRMTYPVVGASELELGGSWVPFSPGARNFFWAFWSWNSSSSKSYRPVDSSTCNILKYIYRRSHSPSLPALKWSFQALLTSLSLSFGLYPKKILSPPLGSCSTRNIKFQVWIDILRFRDHWSSDYLQCCCFRCTCRQANDHLCWRLKHAKAGHVWSTASDRTTQTIPGT